MSEAERILAQVRAIHDAWGDTDTNKVNAQRLWEDLDAVLNGLPFEMGVAS